MSLHDETFRESARRHLHRRDPEFRRLIRIVGTFDLVPHKRRSPFESLARAIAHQQLNGTAANTILRRFCALSPEENFPSPEKILALDPKLIRSVGFSENKVKAVRDLAEKTIAGIVPTTRKLNTLDDEEIIERLTLVRGIGRWTVEMLLIFQLGRPDVLPVDDFGVRNGLRLLQGADAMMSPKLLRSYGERWAPHRSAAAWYLWRATEVLKVVKERR
jgi:DNA-3-methyladenine glycosylase II